MAQGPVVPWIILGALVLAALAIDLGWGARGGPSTRHGLRWTAFWIGLGLAFGVWIAMEFGRHAAAQYYAAYLLEKSLSLDNVFVFVIIFAELGIPEKHQHRVLLLGILAALLFRGLLIAAGIALLQRFHWIIHPFAVILLLSAARLLFGQKKEAEIVAKSCGVCSTWVARIIPITPVPFGNRLWVRQGGRLVATPLLIALVVIETSDLVFALDSIPAVLGVTRDPFIVYSSNIFAMLGLRSLYFVLSGALQQAEHLRVAMAFILGFVAVKMLLDGIVDISVGASLAVMGSALTFVTLSSLWRRRSSARR